VSDPGSTAPRPPADPDGDRRSTIAGGILVAVAVLIGVVLLAKGFTDDGGLVTTRKPEGSTGQQSQGADVPATETTQTMVPVDPAAVKVFSANASGTKSGARLVADALEAQGFKGVAVGNAPTTVTSAVYFLPGSEAQAALVAQTLGLDSSAAVAMPSTAPVADLKGATVLVIIGTDGKLATPGTTTTTAAAETTTTAAA
jgi:hypothetical protein